jgi:KDO2-lipid IV(A) lauroyltransferase
VRTLTLRLALLLVAVLPARLQATAIQRLARLRYRRYYAGTRPQAANIAERLRVSPDDAERVLLRSFELELLDLMDGWRMRAITTETATEFVELRNVDRLDAALTHGRGALLSTGHVTGLHTFFVVLGVLGYDPHPIRLRTAEYKGGIARRVHDRSNRRLERLGVTTLWMQPDAFDVGVHALRALKRNAVVCSPVDLTQSQDNAVVEFFGTAAEFPRGLALLAQAADAPLIDVFVYREPSGRLVAEIGEPRAVVDVDDAVRQSADRLEEQVRRHPADWQPWHVFDVWRDRNLEIASR